MPGDWLCHSLAAYVSFQLSTHSLVCVHLIPGFPDHPNLTRRSAVLEAPVVVPSLRRLPVAIPSLQAAHHPGHTQVCLCTSEKGDFSSWRGAPVLA